MRPHHRIFYMMRAKLFAVANQLLAAIWL